MEKNYEELANAIILQAVKDYRAALKALRKNPKSISANKDKADCERFLLGDWFPALTSIDGEMLMKQLQQEVYKNNDSKGIFKSGISS